MNIKYNHKEIEKKWQEKWEEKKLYQVDLDLPRGKAGKAKKPFYNLMMFPYPSAEGLHVGNMYAFVHSDAYGRFMRLKGYDVFEPIGLDGFGIHSENYAIKIGEHIKDVSARTEKHFYEQLHIIGNAYDWSRTVETYKSNYYKWTQWLFLKMHEKGLAYRKKAAVNWCPSCKTVLADEQVIQGECERCHTETEKKQMEQWFFRITDYAERLLKNLETIDWSEEVKTIQRNWIGKSEGALVKFRIKKNGGKFTGSSRRRSAPPQDDSGVDEVIDVFTTRPDTLFGCTYFVLSPEHPLIKNYELKITNYNEVKKYINKAKKKSEIERTDLNKEKTGVKLEGVLAVNPVNNEEIPIWIADYVMMDYGTGAIMAVPAHDERDWEFAKKYDLKIVEVIKENVAEFTGSSRRRSAPPQDDSGAFTGEGVNVNSEFLNGLRTEDAIQEMIKWLEKKKLGRAEVNYKLRDWCISRQRYWGPPIPMIECNKCGWVPVPEKDLPVELPEMDDFLPDGSGKGPLNKVKKFVNTTCPKCGDPAKRETDVSDPFVDSSWYFMRYPGTEFDDKALDKKRLKKWMPVDMYIGGKEHSVLHLLYSRFVTMVMHELGYAPEEEPYKQFRAHGLLICEGAKMSKSKGNIVNPDEYIEKYGADAVRMYLMFLGDMRQGGDWRDNGMAGMYRFVNRIYIVINKLIEDVDNKKIKRNNHFSKYIHKSIRKIFEDIENLKFNTAIAELMIFFNGKDNKPDWRPRLNNNGEWEKVSEVGRAVDCVAIKYFLILLAPFAPHLAEELWSKLGNKKSIFKHKWPEYDSKLVKDDIIELVVQVNGKVRDRLEVNADISEKEAKKVAQESEKIKKWTKGKKIAKVIFVKGKLVNVVVK